MSLQTKKQKKTKGSETGIKKYIIDLIDNVSKQFSTRFLILQNKVEKLNQTIKKLNIEDYAEKTENTLEEFREIKLKNQELIEKVDSLRIGVEKMSSLFEEHLKETAFLHKEVSKQVLLTQAEKEEIIQKLAAGLKEEVSDYVIQKLLKI